MADLSRRNDYFDFGGDREFQRKQNTLDNAVNLLDAGTKYKMDKEAKLNKPVDVPKYENYDFKNGPNKVSNYEEMTKQMSRINEVSNYQDLQKNILDKVLEKQGYDNNLKSFEVAEIAGIVSEAYADKTEDPSLFLKGFEYYSQNFNNDSLTELRNIEELLAKDQTKNGVTNSMDSIDKLDGYSDIEKTAMFNDLLNQSVSNGIFTKGEGDSKRKYRGKLMLEEKINNMFDNVNDFENQKLIIDSLEDYFENGNLNALKEVGLNSDDRKFVNDTFNAMVKDPNNNIQATTKRYEEINEWKKNNYSDFSLNRGMTYDSFSDFYLSMLENTNALKHGINRDSTDEEIFTSVINNEVSFKGFLSTSMLNHLEAIEPKDRIGAIQSYTGFDIENPTQLELLNRLNMENGGTTPLIIDMNMTHPEFEQYSIMGKESGVRFNATAQEDFFGKDAFLFGPNNKGAALVSKALYNYESGKGTGYMNDYYKEQYENYAIGYLLNNLPDDIDPNGITHNTLIEAYDNLDNNKKQHLKDTLNELNDKRMNGDGKRIMEDGQGNYIDYYGEEEFNLKGTSEFLSSAGATLNGSVMPTKFKDYRVAFNPNKETFQLYINDENVMLNGGKELPLNAAILGTKNYEEYQAREADKEFKNNLNYELGGEQKKYIDDSSSKLPFYNTDSTSMYLNSEGKLSFNIDFDNIKEIETTRDMDAPFIAGGKTYTYVKAESPSKEQVEAKKKPNKKSGNKKEIEYVNLEDSYTYKVFKGIKNLVNKEKSEEVEKKEVKETNKRKQYESSQGKGFENEALKQYWDSKDKEAPKPSVTGSDFVDKLSEDALEKVTELGLNLTEFYKSESGKMIPDNPAVTKEDIESFSIAPLNYLLNKPIIDVEGVATTLGTIYDNFTEKLNNDFRYIGEDILEKAKEIEEEKKIATDEDTPLQDKIESTKSVVTKQESVYKGTVLAKHANEMNPTNGTVPTSAVSAFNGVLGFEKKAFETVENSSAREKATFNAASKERKRKANEVKIEDGVEYNQAPYHQGGDFDKYSEDINDIYKYYREKFTEEEAFALLMINSAESSFDTFAMPLYTPTKGGQAGMLVTRASAFGLFQVIDKNKESYGYKKDESVYAYSGMEQAEKTAKILLDRVKSRKGTDNIDVGDLYIELHYPSVQGVKDDDVAYYSSGSGKGTNQNKIKAYNSNKGVDRGNKGYVTRSDIAAFAKTKNNINAAKKIVEEYNKYN